MSNVKTSKMDNNTKKSPASKLINYSKNYLPYFVIAFIFAFLGSLLTIIGPNKLSEITDIITSGLNSSIDTDAVVKIAISLVILYTFGFIFTYTQGIILNYTAQRVVSNLRRDVTKKINKLPLRYFDSHNHGDTLSRVTNDIDTIGQSLSQSTSVFIAASTLVIATIIMMFISNWILALTSIICSVLGFFAVLKIMGNSQIYFIQQQRAIAKINDFIEETYSGEIIIKTNNANKKSIEEFHELNMEYYNNNWKSQFLASIMQPLMLFVGNFGYVAVCIVGSILVIQHSISFGIVVAFMIYIRLFTQPLSQISQAFATLQPAMAASDRIFEFLEEKELSDESNKTNNFENIKYDVEFSHISFGYNEELIIKDFSVSAKEGQKIAIVGPTGAGKSTLVNLLMKFYEVNLGEIKIGDIPISSVTREEVHKQFCMVLQDTWLFEGTIYENIVYNKENVPLDHVIEICKKIGIHHFIMTLEDGYNAILDDSVSLSAGQKQLITIARALVKDSPMLILDEATSSVDTRTEELIQNAMDTLMVNRTSFVIAHRLSTIKNSDLILVLKDGNIIESGTHDELIAQKSFYADLYNSQFEEL